MRKKELRIRAKIIDLELGRIRKRMREIVKELDFMCKHGVEGINIHWLSMLNELHNLTLMFNIKLNTANELINNLPRNKKKDTYQFKFEGVIPDLNKVIIYTEDGKPIK